MRLVARHRFKDPDASVNILQHEQPAFFVETHGDKETEFLEIIACDQVIFPVALLFVPVK